MIFTIFATNFSLTSTIMVFRNIEINGYRGIQHALIDDFKQVNLFFGQNNCGKSSLLDAIFLISGLSNPFLAVQINFVRGYGKTGLNDLGFSFYNLNTDNPIHIKTEGIKRREIKISLFEYKQDKVLLDTKEGNMLSNKNGEKYGLRLNSMIGNKSLFSELIFDSSESNNVTNKVPKDYEETLHCSYLSPKYDFMTSLNGLKNILQNKDEHFIMDGLKLIEPRIVDFVFTDGEMFVDVGLGKRIPVNMMGDGARKIVSLLTAIYDCKEGVLLVDEISNGFHYSVMCNLWKVLLHAAKRNNTQLFVTTHDIDSIKGLKNAAFNSEYADNIAAFKLLRTKDDELKSYYYSVDGLKYAINQEIELR